jgi:GT2 family glycosyltransferase
VAVAVLLVNYQVYEDLDRALSSLRGCLGPDDEVVVVDQASDARRLGALERLHPAVRFVPTDRNVGFAAGVNLAAGASGAPFLLLLNPDALAEPPVIAGLERWLIDHPETGVVGPRVLNEDGSVQASARRFPGLTTAFGGRSTWLTSQFPDNWFSRRNLPARAAVDAVEVDWVAGSCLMTRRRLFEELGGFDESFFLYWEDADFCRRAAALGWRTVYLPTVSVRHVGGRSSARDPVPAIRAFHDSAFRFHVKHAGPMARLFAPVTRMGLRVRAHLLARGAKTRYERAATPPAR